MSAIDRIPRKSKCTFNSQAFINHSNFSDASKSSASWDSLE